MSATIIHGDCLDVLRGMADASVDAVVTDPPYELAFMGRKWDASGIAYSVDLWREVLRVLKPGGHCLAFGGTRTYHRMTCAIEDAGAEIRDCITWHYGQGFPKSARVSRDPAFCQCGEAARSGVNTSRAPLLADHIGTAETCEDDAHAPSGAHRSTSERLGFQDDCLPARDSGDAQPHRVEAAGQASAPSRGCAPERTRSVSPDDGPASEQGRSPSPAPHTSHLSSPGSSPQQSSRSETSARTRASKLRAGTLGSDHYKPGNLPAASLHEYAHGFPSCNACNKPIADGFGTALKPSTEPIVVARKPLVGTVAANVAQHGTGAINVDGCRVDSGPPRTTHKDGHRSTANRGMWQAGNGGGLHAFEHEVPSGRWPPNLLLTHSADCVRVGERSVKSSTLLTTHTLAESENTAMDGKNYARNPRRDYSPDGTETVPAYDCADDCPVAMMDRQSGVSSSRASGYDFRDSNNDNPTHVIRNIKSGVHFGDSGGASRFFPTFDADPFLYQAKASQKERFAALICDCEALHSDAWESADREQNEPTGCTSLARDTSEATSTDGCGLLTSSNGSATTAPCPPGTKSTTATRTSRTTQSTILSSLTPQPTSACTPGANSGTACGGSRAARAESSSPSTGSTSTSHPKAGRSTGVVAVVTSRESSKPSACARCGEPLRREAHPTQKPTALMQWLVRLVTPPGGLILDPFAGSGTTLVAALAEGRHAIGIEREAEYVEIIKQRIAKAEAA